MADDKDAAADTITPPRKYSRYKSVRRQAETAAASLAAPEQDGAVSRSMSRYRRPNKPNPAASPPMPKSPLPRSNPPLSTPVKSRDGTRRVTDPPLPTAEKEQLPSGNPTVAHRAPTRRQETDAEHRQRKAKEARDLEARYREAQKEEEALELAKRESEAEKTRRAEEEAASILAEQKRKDLERLEAELEAAVPREPLSPPLISPGREKFAFFSRKRATTRTSPPAATRTRNASLSAPLPKSGSAGSIGMKTQPGKGVIKQGGGGIVPGTDVPLSASNAGNNRVLVRYKQSSIFLPVTSDTIAEDLLYSAANVMSQNINPATAVLLESYSKLGLIRRLRRFERIKDVMNSWDQESKNDLVVETSDSPKSDVDLDASSVPESAPKEVSVYLYHSRKPGKWDKRYVTLLSSGQIFMSKKNAAKLTDKDSVSLCHLSDFDIYTPIPQQIRKHLHPPKKYCHAIKSQHKTTMFLNTENFVHFFSTDMEEIAEIWSQAVQRWRGWYLVNRMGIGKPEPKPEPVEVVSKSTGSKSGPSHRVKVSVDVDPYTIGSFKPLLDMDRFTPKNNDDSDEENRPLQIPLHLRNKSASPSRPTTRSHHPPPISYKLPPEAEEFSNSGLLGRTYSQRQKAAKDREIVEKNSAIPIPPIPNFPPPVKNHHRSNSMKSSRSIVHSPTRRPETSAGPQRHATTREKPKPLLDFTPTFKEPPQWDKTGKGHGVKAASGVLLVDVATTPEDPLGDVPRASATVFRRQQEGAFVQGGLVSGRTDLK